MSKVRNLDEQDQRKGERRQPGNGGGFDGADRRKGDRRNAASRSQAEARQAGSRPG